MSSFASLQIRPMVAEDAPSAATIEGAEHAAEAALREELVRPWAHLWVATTSPSCVDAFLSTWHVVDELHILNIATRTSARRRGLGFALMQTALAFSRERAVRTLLLEVRRGNAPAIALYRKLGFFATNLRKSYYPDGEDAVVMDLVLDPATGTVEVRADEIRL